MVSDYSEVEMKRRVDVDGMATEEYNFNSEVPIEQQVKGFPCCILLSFSLIFIFHNRLPSCLYNVVGSAVEGKVSTQETKISEQSSYST